MPLWWIILSPITSAKSVKLLFTPSYTAHVVAAGVLLVLMWAVAVSAIPLVASLWLVISLVTHSSHRLLPEPLCGEVEIHFDGYLRIKERKLFFQSISDLHAFAFLSFKGKGRHWLLWRDSCDEITYRQLLVRLKQKQEH